MFDYRRVTILWEKYDGQTIPIFRPTHCGLVLVLVFLLIIVVILDLRSDQLTTMVHLTVSWSCMATAWRSENTMRYHHFYCWVLEVEKCGNILKNQPLPTIFAAAQFHPQTLGLAIAILDLCTSLLCTLKFGLVQSFWLSLYPHQQTSTSEEVRR